MASKHQAGPQDQNAARSRLQLRRAISRKTARNALANVPADASGRWRVDRAVRPTRGPRQPWRNVCQKWANKAEALASYAKQAHDTTLRKMADRIQARAIRRCGELLKQIKPARGANQNIRAGTGPKAGRKQAAADAGLSARQRKTALRVANVPKAEFEKAVESPNPPTVGAPIPSGLSTRRPRRRVSAPAGASSVQVRVKDAPEVERSAVAPLAGLMEMRTQRPRPIQYGCGLISCCEYRLSRARPACELHVECPGNVSLCVRGRAHSARCRRLGAPESLRPGPFQGPAIDTSTSERN
jgi:hypothetical protein